MNCETLWHSIFKENHIAVGLHPQKRVFLHQKPWLVVMFMAMGREEPPQN